MIGTLPPMISSTMVLVYTVVAVIKPDFTPIPNPNEVQSAIYIRANR